MLVLFPHSLAGAASEKPVSTRSMEPFFTTGPWERATPQGINVVFYKNL